MQMEMEYLELGYQLILSKEVDSRGLVIGQNYTILPSDDGSGNYYFQQVGQAVSITDQPTNQSACIGEPAEFEVSRKPSKWG